MKTLHGSVWSYIFAILLPLALLGSRLTFLQPVVDAAPVSLYLMVCILVGLAGGLKPGLIGTALSAVICQYFIMPPRLSFAIESDGDQIRFVLLLVLGFLVSWSSESLHSARTHAKAEMAERRRSQSKIAEQQQLLDNVNDAVLATDENLRITSWNQGAIRMYGYTEEEAVGQTVPQLFRTEILGGDVADARRQLHENAEYRTEALTYAKDGTPIFVTSSVTALRDEAGAVIGYVGINRDITARKHWEQSLVRMAERRRLLSEVSARLAISLDYETTLNNVAQLAAPQLGDWCSVYLVKDDGLLRQVALAHSDPAILENVSRAEAGHFFDSEARFGVMKTIRTGEVQLAPDLDDPQIAFALGDDPILKLVRELGFKAYMCLPLKVGDHRLGGITFATSSPQRRFDEDDLSLAAQLADRIALAIENARLYADMKQARFEAERANRMKDDFLATLSHELRTPMTALQGWSMLLTSGRTLDKPRVDAAIDSIRRNTEALGQLVNDLLDVSRITTGKLKLDVTDVRIEEVLADALDSVRHAAEAKRIQLEAAIEPKLPVVRADSGRLQQVFWNLLSNAVKFTPSEGSVKVSVRAKDSEVECTVQDSGVGIPPDFLPHVFDRFRQADATRSRSAGGLGLGLSIVQHLVEMHGGFVSAHSEGEGHGASFTIRLPIPAQTRRQTA